MAIIACHACGADNEVRVVASQPRRKHVDDRSVDTRTLRAVLEFMKRVGPGRKTTSELHALYGHQRSTFQAPDVSVAALGRALHMNGAKKWRNAQERGWEIPEIPEDRRPAPPRPSVQAAEERDQEAWAATAVTTRATAPQPIDDDDIPPFLSSDPLLQRKPAL